MKRLISIILSMVILSLTLFSCDESGQGKGPDNTDVYGTGACVYATERDTTGRNVGYVEICIEKYGKIVLLLDATTAPKTVVNFIGLVKAGFYDAPTDDSKESPYANTFHLIDPGFVIQGGCFNKNGTGQLTDTVEGEFASNGYYENDIKHLRGVISMVRQDNPNSASCQFFICLNDLAHLDGEYASFGYVIQGMSVIDAVVADYAQYADAEQAGIIFDVENQPVIKYIKWIPDKDGYWAGKHS